MGSFRLQTPSDVHPWESERGRRALRGIVEVPMRSVVATAYTVQQTDRDIQCDATAGNQTITLMPAALWRGRDLTITRIDSSVNTCTVSPNGSETISGAASLALSQWHSYTLRGDISGNWLLVNKVT